MIENIKAHLQKQRDFRATVSAGVGRLNDSDPRAVALLLGSLQFAGGWYLFVPFAMFLPPFNKLFEVLPSWFWAIYFITSGIAAMVSSLLPDGVIYLRARFLIAIWMVFNWCFFVATSYLTVMWVLKDKDAVSYGLALAFYPCLAAGSLWTARRTRQLLADETAEEFDQDHHIRELKHAAAVRDERLKEVVALAEV